MTALENNIRPFVIDKAVKKFKKMKMVKNACTLIPTSKSKIIYGKLPYYPKLSEKLQSNAKRYNINIGLKPTCTIKSMMPVIKQTQEKYKKNGIYEITCNDCDCNYIGQTSRNFKTRFKEHESAIRLNHADKSHFAKHVLDNNHSKNVTLNNLQILDYSNDFRIRNFMESYFIRDRKQKGHCVNIDDGLCNSNLVQFALNLNKIVHMNATKN